MDNIIAMKIKIIKYINEILLEMNKEFSVNILTFKPYVLTCNFNLNQKVEFKLRIATIKTTDFIYI